MKILHTLPFVVAALLVIWASAVGTNPSFMWMIGILLMVVAALVSVLGYANLPAPFGLSNGSKKPHSGKRRQQIIGASLALIFSTLALHWPLRMCFWMSRPALERVAAQAQCGATATPQDAGLFIIKDAHVENDEVVLRLDHDRSTQDVNGVQPTALVRKLGGWKNSRYGGDAVSLGSDWYFWSEM